MSSTFNCVSMLRLSLFRSQIDRSFVVLTMIKESSSSLAPGSLMYLLRLLMT